MSRYIRQEDYLEALAIAEEEHPELAGRIAHLLGSSKVLAGMDD